MTKEKKEKIENEQDDLGDETSSKDSNEKNKKSEEKLEGSQLEKKEDESERYIRLMAEFQNYKKRVEKEKKDIYAFANEKIVVELLDVIDNFERALEHTTTDEKVEQGMNNVFKMFSNILAKNGLKEIESLGEKFDPSKHNAVMTGESEKYKSEEIMEVLQKGYELNNKVIRPSMVKVVN